MASSTLATFSDIPASVNMETVFRIWFQAGDFSSNYNITVWIRLLELNYAFNWSYEPNVNYGDSGKWLVLNSIILRHKLDILLKYYITTACRML